MSSCREIAIAALAAATFAAGCGGNQPRPTEEMTRARTLIEQAERQGAQRYGAAELEQARDKLQRANAAADEGEMQVAQRLASEAALDAQLATARTSSGEAQRSADEVAASVETLRREAARQSERAMQPQ